MVKVIGVRFRTAGKIYYFDPLNFQVKRGDHLDDPEKYLEVDDLGY